jgi:hypothetical protein
MGKCDFEITKGKKKGTKCGIYTSKMIGKKYYCVAHYNHLKKEDAEDSEHDEVVETKKKTVKKTIKKPEKKVTKKKLVKKEPCSPRSRRDALRDPESEEDEDELEESKEDSLSEIEEPKKKKYEPYEPSEKDLEEKDIDELLDEAIEHEKDKPNDIKLMDKVDLLINKVAKIKRMIKQRKAPVKKNTTIEEDLEMEIFN